MLLNNVQSIEIKPEFNMLKFNSCVISRILEQSDYISHLDKSL